MKYLFILLFSVAMFSQDRLVPATEVISPEVDRIVVDTEITPYLEVFVKEYHDRGLDYCQTIIKNIDSIKVSNQMPFPMIAFYRPSEKNIYIHPIALTDSLTAKVVLAHELGHAILRRQETDHCHPECEDILTATFPISFEVYRDNWKEKLDDYFNYLEEK